MAKTHITDKNKIRRKREMQNLPEIKIGIVAVSRDCFPIELSEQRRVALLDACKKSSLPVVGIETVVENEKDALKAEQELKEKGANALVLFLGNFGPEGPTTILAERFGGPVMLVAAAEERTASLAGNRGDAYCGMLNASYNLGLRKIRAYIPEYPVGTPDKLAEMIAEFLPIARVTSALKQLKIFSFGPRPQDFLACNAPIKPLYDLGIEIMENSELDLYDIFKEAEGSKEIDKIADDMAKELGAGNSYPELLKKLAQYEFALTKFMDENLGASKFGIFANKCWPSFEKYFGFVPCFINSRLAARGIPVSCEVDIYGALSEYMITSATELPATLLDINNSVPQDMFDANQKIVGDYTLSDLFMGFHCGNTCSECLVNPAMKYQVIMHRLMEPDSEPNITRGTIEGQLKPGDITLFRLQSTADTVLKSYIAEGEILNINPESFGSIAVFAIPEMGRFYRHVLIEQRFPHHAGIAFAKTGKALHSALQLMGVENIYTNQPKAVKYPSENLFV
jgi:L-fucose isomerase-like protein